MAQKKSSGKEKKKRLVLLDAHAIIHRAYHALPDFTSPTGEPTGALYGLSAMLLKIVQELKPDYVVACYDLPGPTYRHDVYDGYKAGRAELEDALVAQLNRSREVFEAFSVPIYEHPGFEADDMLGTIVEQVSAKGGPASGGKDIDVIIASGDMDTLQLVDDKRVQVYTLKKGIRDTILYDEKAVEERFGFPPKLLTDFKGLRGDPSDNIIGISGIGEKGATELIKAFGTIENMYKALKRGKEEFVQAGIKPRLIELLEAGKEEAEFSKMLATIRRDAPISFELPEKTWRETLSPERALTLFGDLGFRTLSERIRELFMGTASLGLETSQPEPEVVAPEELWATSTALWLINSDITNPTLDDILQYARTKEFTRAKKLIFDELKRQKLERVWDEIEQPLIPVVRMMNERGVCIDKAYLAELGAQYHKELSKLEREIYAISGGEFNINSPKQLGEILFDKLNLGVRNQKRTATGQRSTKESELEKLREQHPVIEKILAYRELQKLLSTYIDNIPLMVDGSGRLHTTFLQAGTTTGRMGSQTPNLQNIPIRSDLGRKIRNAFIATEGFQLVAFDYSQIELRVAAFLSGDEKLLQIFRDAGDVHRAVAAQVFSVPPEQVDTEMRRRAKIINFGILYGMGVNALRQNLGTTRAEAQTFYNEYFKNFSGLARYLDQVKAETQRLGYTETYFGRRRHFESMRSGLPYIKAQAERMAINAPIQGTEADIIKLAMVRIHAYLTKHNLLEDAFLLLQVHDELVYEIKTEQVSTIVPEIKKIMESVLPLSETKGVRLIVDAKVGKNWGEMENIANRK